MDREAGKKKAAYEAARLVEDGMTLGIGTGSTTKYFIDALGEKITKDGWSLKGIPTSEESARLAQEAGIDVIEPDETTVINLAVDGADEADLNLNLIKGGGGALLREKIVARAANRFVVIADKSKRVAALGAFPLPIEIDPFSWALTVRSVFETLRANDYSAPRIEIRSANGAPKMSDGGNLLIDCALDRINAPAILHASLIQIPGVIETGLFCGDADMAIFGDDKGVFIEHA